MDLENQIWQKKSLKIMMFSCYSGNCGVTGWLGLKIGAGFVENL